jgi:two-component system, chemotaxis family, protein-glutamate methylesterase/glutaminase
MSNHNIIAIGASAGGVEALREVVRSFPPDFDAAIFIVLHIPPIGVSLLPEILRRSGALPAHHAIDREAIRAGHIYVAPPDHHLLINHGYVRVMRGPKENRVRPAIDPLFRSAARYSGPRVIGVVLSGLLDDGTAGLSAIKQRGGIAVVQDPHDPLYPGMPQNALRNVDVDYCLPIGEIGPLLVQLALEPAEEEDTYPLSETMEIESKVLQTEHANMENVDKLGEPSIYSCPECQGTLWEIYDGDLLRFRCHVGHAYSAESLIAEQTEALEGALWTALRSLEENIAISKRMAHRAYNRDQELLARRFEDRALELEQHASSIRQVLQSNNKLVIGEE